MKKLIAVILCLSLLLVYPASFATAQAASQENPNVALASYGTTVSVDSSEASFTSARLIDGIPDGTGNSNDFS